MQHIDKESIFIIKALHKNNLSTGNKLPEKSKNAVLYSPPRMRLLFFISVIGSIVGVKHKPKLSKDYTAYFFKYRYK